MKLFTNKLKNYEIKSFALTNINLESPIGDLAKNFINDRRFDWNKTDNKILSRFSNQFIDYIIRKLL